MIRMAFMTDAQRVIGATTAAGNAERLRVLPAALHPVMESLYQTDAVVVGRSSLGPWLERTEVTVHLLSRTGAPAPAPHVQVVSDPMDLVEKYQSSEETLLVAGGREVFRAFLPYAQTLQVAETDALVPGDLAFEDWVGRFRLVEEQAWEGGRTRTYTRRGEGLNRAISLYMHGIRDGHPVEAIHAYTGARYTQHSTGVADGKEGFIEFFTEFLARTPDRDIKVLRAIEGDGKVFLHVYQSLNSGEAKWITADFFDFDEAERIIEHWDVIAAYAERTPSDHSSIDGPTEVVDLESTEANKAVVRELLAEVLVSGGDLSRLRALVAEDYVEHCPDRADGLAALREVIEDGSLVYDELVLLVGEGNLVATLSKATCRGEPSAQVDIFRLDGGRVVEHWEAVEPVPTPEVAKNSGKF